jgi:hypothetical protein
MKIFAAAAAITALYAIPPAAAQTGNSQFCLQTAAGAQCVYDRMGDCERARGSSAQCMTSADARGATGLGDPPGRPPGIPTEPPPSATAPPSAAER